MQWRSSRQSSNVEDQRGMGMGKIVPVGGVGTLILGLIIYFLGGDPTVVMNPSGGGSRTTVSRQSAPSGGGQNDETKQFVSSVLGDTEDTWSKFFEQRGQRYQEPKLVLFSGQVQSACGVAGSSTGPFYCPNDQKLYLDTAFFREMSEKLNAPGDFAQAYVIAHEVGHHVQNQFGILEKVDALRERVSKTQANQLSVRLELQADFYAGVWAHYAQRKKLLDPGDVEEALGAASAVGDDKLQQQARGYVVPDSFTHGTSEQRVAWFMKGYKSGDLTQGNTFGAEFR
jgi:predicted metalloprotease